MEFGDQSQDSFDFYDFGVYWKYHRLPKPIILDFGSRIFCRTTRTQLGKNPKSYFEILLWKNPKITKVEKMTFCVPFLEIRHFENSELGK